MFYCFLGTTRICAILFKLYGKNTSLVVEAALTMQGCAWDREVNILYYRQMK